MSLRLRLLLTLAPLFILGLAAADAGTYAALQTSLLQGADKQLVAINNGVMNVLENQGVQGPAPPGGDGGIAHEYAFPAGTYGEIVNASGPLTGGALYGGYVAATSSHPVFPAGIYNDTNAILTDTGYAKLVASAR